MYGSLRPVDIISKSSNVGIAKIAERVGPKHLYEKLISLGYGQKTGLNLQGESSGMFAKLDNWDGYTLHSVSFGQGMAVTDAEIEEAENRAENIGVNTQYQGAKTRAFTNEDGELNTWGYISELLNPSTAIALPVPTNNKKTTTVKHQYPKKIK